MTAAPQLKLVPKDTNHDIDKLIEETAAGVEGSRFALAVREKGGVDYVPPSGPMRFNDIANAERFLTEFGGNLLFCVETQSWMIYLNGFWKKDDTFFVTDYARMWAKAELENALPEGDKQRIKNADRLNNDAGFNAMIKQSKYQRAITISKFDAPPTHYLLNCKNCTIDLKTGEERKHAREDFITRSVAVEWQGKEAECPTFEAFLEDIQPDPEIREFLKRSVGYSLLGVVRERSFWILYGSGNNGKSIFTNLLLQILGPYGCTTTSETIMDMKRPGGSANSDIARLKGKRFVLIPETNENERLNAALLKALSAGDVITARHLYGEFFDFPFTGKMWIATNHKPTVTDHSKGFWDRLKLVPFTTNISDSKVVKSDVLLARLMAEAPGILAWAVRGCIEYLEKDSLDVPAVIQREIDQYKFEQDSIAQFLANACQTWEQFVAISEQSRAYATEADFQVPNKELYDAYLKYCKENGEFPRSHKRLSQNMQERGFRQGRSGSRYWEGVRLI